MTKFIRCRDGLVEATEVSRVVYIKPYKSAGKPQGDITLLWSKEDPILRSRMCLGKLDGNQVARIQEVLSSLGVEFV